MSEVIPVGIVGERIEQIRRMHPPPKGRNARQPWNSYDDFAVLVGCPRQQIVDWIKGRTQPSDRNRQKLAALSKGVFTADDLKGPQIPSELEQVMARLDVLQSQLVKLTREVAKLTKGK